MFSDASTIKRKYFLNMADQFAKNLDDLLKPVVGSVENRLSKAEASAKRRTVKVQTDVNEFLDLAESGQKNSHTATYFDTLLLSCADESRPFLQNLRKDIEHMDSEVTQLFGEYRKLIPKLRTIVPKIDDQELIIKDVAYILKHLDIVTRSKMVPWYSYNGIYTPDQLHEFAYKGPDFGGNTSVQLESGIADIADSEASTLNAGGEDQPSNQDINTSTSEVNRRSPDSLDPTSPQPLVIDTAQEKRGTPVQLNDTTEEVNSHERLSSDSLDDRNRDKDPDVSESFTYQVKQCSVKDCDYSVDATSNASFTSHYANFHVGVYKIKKWNLVEISSETYKNRREKWFPSGSDVVSKLKAA